MGSILDNYKRQLEEDRANKKWDNTPPSLDDELGDSFSMHVDMEQVQQRVKELRDDPNDMENVYNKFNAEYPKITENELDETGKTKIQEDIKVCVKRVYCPNCGKELISKSPVMFNPFTLEKVAKHECSCGFKCNLDYAYPRLMYVDSENNEINAFSV